VTGCSEEESMNVMAGLVDEFLNIQYEEEGLLLFDYLLLLFMYFLLFI
jgi:hypothetical protein